VGREPDGVSRLHLRTLFGVGVTTGLTDGQLLERFATHGGEAAELAFAAIVERHGPMVFRTCRGILRDDHEAMDAFQATFLVLLRKGSTLWVRDSLGPWLHRVACRAARRAKVNSDRRRAHERGAAERGWGRQRGGSSGDLAVVLHEEVDRLPNYYRVPVVLCDVEGRTYEEAARHMGCPVGTVRSRLARGRRRLRDRLIRRGLAPSAGFLAAALAAEAATAAMPANLVGSTIRVATRILAGGATTAGEVSASVLEITEGVRTMMFLNKLKLVSAALLTAVGLAAIGAGVLAQQATDDGQPGTPRPRPRPEAEAPPKPMRPSKERSRWVYTLPNGGTIEVIGVSTHPSGPNTWWGPDGSPLDQPPCDPSNTSLATNEKTMVRAIVARVSNLPPDANAGWWIDQAKSGSGGTAVRDHKIVPGLGIVVVELPKDLATGTIRFSAATGPWQTVATLNGFAGAGSAHDNSPNYISGKAIATQRGTTLTVTHDIQDDATRLVAVDRDGKEHPSLDGAGVGLKGFTQLEAEFDLSPEEFREYRLQQRPYERMEIPNIALEPTKAE
jgi:RNA polymerase sigma factor (sigma-70 family)